VAGAEARITHGGEAREATRDRAGFSQSPP